MSWKFAAAAIAAYSANAAIPLRSAELADIAADKPCSSVVGGIGASGHCRISSSPKGLAVDLKAEAFRGSFDLPSGITFPGSQSKKITIDDLRVFNGSFVPEVWQLNAGDELRVKLTNALPPGPEAATNLHTHGLLVSPGLKRGPDGKAVEPVGDTVFVCTRPASEPTPGVSDEPCAMHGALYGQNPSEMNYRIALPASHPEGLFWYHPHVHGNSRPQVSAGMSGLIFIRGLPTGASGGAVAPPGVATSERFIILKDIQFGRIDAADPAELTAKPLPMEERDSQLCPDAAAGGLIAQGACFNPDKKAGWLFTVNGQVDPETSVASGQKQIWRIANASADMTYDLALVQKETGRPLRVQLLARDGVSAVAESGKGAVMTERMLLMPGARVEIGVDRAVAEGLTDATQPLNAVLRTYGYYTGGDSWPAADLMNVTFEPSSGASVTAAAGPRDHLLMKAARRPSAKAIFQPFDVKPWTPALDILGSPGLAAPAAGQNAFMPMSRMGMNTLASKPPPCPSLRPGEDRILALAIDKPSGKPENFKIGVGASRLQKGSPPDSVVDQLIAASKKFDGATDICVHAGTTETWTIVNKDSVDNHEMHNFHVHQMKFEVIGVNDPTSRIQLPIGRSRKVDSFPVPINGSIRIKVGFNERQVGRFVFHCHILEHEDKGMMGAIEVRSARN